MTPDRLGSLIERLRDLADRFGMMYDELDDIDAIIAALEAYARLLAERTG